jgi:Ras-related protein Rab-18
MHRVNTVHYDAPTPQSQSQELINVKLPLIGNSSVGKSSLLLRFSDKQWLPEEEASATIGDGRSR